MQSIHDGSCSPGSGLRKEDYELDRTTQSQSVSEKLKKATR